MCRQKQMTCPGQCPTRFRNVSIVALKLCRKAELSLFGTKWYILETAQPLDSTHRRRGSAIRTSAALGAQHIYNNASNSYLCT